MSCSPWFITFFREKSISEQESRRLREHSSGNAQPTGIPSQERHQLNRDGNARVVLRAGGGWGERDKMKNNRFLPGNTLVTTRCVFAMFECLNVWWIFRHQEDEHEGKIFWEMIVYGNVSIESWSRFFETTGFFQAAKGGLGLGLGGGGGRGRDSPYK